MEKKKFTAYFTKRNTFRLVVIELQIIALLLCAFLALTVDVSVRLYGEETVTLTVGEEFHDPGAAATADGRTLKVKISGQVDVTTPGTYEICYQARYLLSWGKAYRTVIVVAAAQNAA